MNDRGSNAVPEPPAAGPSRLHGRRSGKSLSAFRRGLMDTMLPRLAIDPAAPIDPARLFETAKTDLWLEIGFGAGEHLLATAARYPDVGLIGCEPFRNGMAHALCGLNETALDNLRFFFGDATDVLAALPAASIGRTFILYPDPWPKRRQRKRRLISDAFLGELARVMRPGADLRFATDIDDYCGWTLAHLARSPCFDWEAEQATDWTVPWPNWFSTRYEAKAIAAGRPSSYITAKRR